MLIIDNISKSFGKNKILEKINLKVFDNEIIGFIGPNGAGKTTLIKIISGLILPDSGRILLNDKKITMEKISSVFDGTRNLYWNISVKENFYYFSALKGVSKNDVKTLLEKNKDFFQVDNLLEKKFGELSLGQKQIVAIITSILSMPELLCLDEPSNGLDIHYEKKLINLIVNYSKNLKNKIFVSSHNINFLYKIASKFIVVNNGNILGEFQKSNLTLEDITVKYLNLLEGKDEKIL